MPTVSFAIALGNLLLFEFSLPRSLLLAFVLSDSILVGYKVIVLLLLLCSIDIAVFVGAVSTGGELRG